MRPILHERVEAAARAGNMAECSRLLAESENISVAGSTTPLRRRLLGALVGYFGWNAVASAVTYYALGTEAKRAQKEAEGGAVERVLHVKSFAFSADLRGGKASRSVWILPHVYATDAFYGRSEWDLTCRKRDGRTEYFSGTRPEAVASPESDAGADAASGAAAGGGAPPAPDIGCV